MVSTTESINVSSKNIDSMQTSQILKIINSEDKTVAYQVEKAIPDITTVVNKLTEILSKNGRLFYIGAGTSGRLAVLDASECPPTFSVSSDLIQGIIAGGDVALRNAVEGAEDSSEEGERVISRFGITNNDAVLGISASGNAPFVVAALSCASKIGAYTISLTCNSNCMMKDIAASNIEVIVGPEIITGSTRMKAGTAQKLVLNMISTAVMIKLGKTYKNYMVDLKASNLKLKSRAIKIVTEITAISEKEAKKVLNACNYEVKTAIVMILANVSKEQAIKLIKDSNGFIRNIIKKE